MLYTLFAIASSMTSLILTWCSLKWAHNCSTTVVLPQAGGPVISTRIGCTHQQVNVKCAVYAGFSSPFLRPWAHRWITHWSLWRMASVTPDLRLPSQPQDIIAPWPVGLPNYTDWRWDMCANNLPKIVTWKRNGCESNLWPFESQDQCHNHYTTAPNSSSTNIHVNGKYMLSYTKTHV